MGQLVPMIICGGGGVLIEEIVPFLFSFIIVVVTITYSCYYPGRHGGSSFKMLGWLAEKMAAQI